MECTLAASMDPPHENVTPAAPDQGQLTAAEQRYVRDLNRLTTSFGPRVLGWVLELAPGVGLFAYGLLSDDLLFLIFGFLSQLYFSLWRMFAQYRGARLLVSIRRKQRLSDVLAPPDATPK